MGEQWAETAGICLVVEKLFQCTVVWWIIMQAYPTIVAIVMKDKRGTHDAASDVREETAE